MMIWLIIIIIIIDILEKAIHEIKANTEKANTVIIRNTEKANTEKANTVNANTWKLRYRKRKITEVREYRIQMIEFGEDECRKETHGYILYIFLDR